MVNSTVDGRPLDLKYNMTFLNGDEPWLKQFSYDEQGLLECKLVFVVCYVLMGVIVIRVIVDLTKKGQFFLIAKTAVSTQLLETMAILCSLVSHRQHIVPRHIAPCELHHSPFPLSMSHAHRFIIASLLMMELVCPG